MKRSKKYLILTISMLIIFTLVVGCSSKSADNIEATHDRATGSAPAESMPSPVPSASEEKNFGGNMDNSVSSPLEPEKVITTVYLSFETMEFEKSNEELNKLIEKYKAYVESSNISYNQYYNSKSYRNGEYVIRVPRENIISFKTELNVIGNITNENTNKQDVTKQYTDTESRLKVITVKEDRILALMQKAEKIEDVIALENQLSQIIYEKESLKSSLITLDDKVDFSTVNINLQEVVKLTNTETVETTFDTKVANAIKDSIYSFKNTLEGLIILLIYLFPFLIILGIIVFFVIKILKKRNKNKLE